MDDKDDEGVNRMVKNLRDLALGKARERKSFTLPREEVQKRKRDLDLREKALDSEKIRLRDKCAHDESSRVPTFLTVDKLESQKVGTRHKCVDCGKVFERE